MGNIAKARIELLRILLKAEDAVKNGRTAPARETFDDLSRMLEENVKSRPSTKWKVRAEGFD